MTRRTETDTPDDTRLDNLVQFGEDALAARDLDELLSVAVRDVATALGTAHAKILEVQSNGRLLVRAGIGWASNVVGKATIDGGTESPPGFALSSRMPVRSNNFDTETRFKIPKLLSDHKIKSAINVIIRGNGQPFGVLEVDSIEPRAFTPSDTAFLQQYSQLLSAAISRIGQNQALELAATEYAVLLSELHHRIGNDFQLILSLINFRIKNITDSSGKAELKWVAGRLQALGSLHKLMRATNSSTHVDLGSYITSMANELSNVHQLRLRSVRVVLDVVTWRVGASEAINAGLIINEFVSNSLEHAFNGRSGTISISLRIQDGSAILSISDDGPGFDRAKPTRRSGFELMRTLAKSLSDEFTEHTNNGVKLTMRMKKPL